jgi:hypothetical protein
MVVQQQVLEQQQLALVQLPVQLALVQLELELA